MTWLAGIWSFIKWLAGIISGKPSDPVAVAAKEAESAGQARQQASDAISAARSAEAVAQSEAQDAAATSADVDKRLADGTF